MWVQACQLVAQGSNSEQQQTRTAIGIKNLWEVKFCNTKNIESVEYSELNYGGTST